MHKIVFIALLGLACVPVGCTPKPEQVAQNKRAYYHDRSTTVGSNIPRSYSDSQQAGSNDPHMSDMQTEQFQALQTQQSVQYGTPQGGGR